MKNFFIYLFRGNPFATGLLVLFILKYLLEIQKNWCLMMVFYVCCVVGYMLFILPKIEQQKREKTTWLVVALLVVISTSVAMFL